MVWTQILPSIWHFKDSCNVYAIEGPSACVLINAGSGNWLKSLDALPKKPAALACTHYFRDHSAGAAGAARAGIPVYVPEYERAVFADPLQHFRQRETYIIYDNLWDLYAPITPTPVAGVLHDYDRMRLAGIEFEVLPLPGATLTQAGLATVLPDGTRVVFCGEAIHSPGRLPRIAPLQYNYNDLNGAAQCEFSARALRAHKPDALLPSLGQPMIGNADAALEELQHNLNAMLSVRQGMPAAIKAFDIEPLANVTDHVWLDNRSFANTWYVISKSGKALAIDYGYNTKAAWQGYAKPERRRALLHGLDGLKKQFGIERIDVVLASHFHDDHVCGIPVLQRLYGTQCWAAENFADLLASPEAHCFPCNWPVAAKIDRRLSLNETFAWEEYTFRLHPMSGHTRFAALIGFEVDGKRFAHTGDQYFFNEAEGPFANCHRSQNHVYRNGALLNGYAQSGKWMLEWKPDIVLQGHQPAMFTDASFFEHVTAWDEDYAGLAKQLMPLGENDVHFDMDGWGGFIWPYRTHLKKSGTFSVNATVRNPFPRSARLTLRLIGLEGWRGETLDVTAAARSEVTCKLSITPIGLCRRQPFAVELTADGQPFGQVAEALVTIGGDEF